MVKASEPGLSIGDVFYCPNAFLPQTSGMAKFKLSVGRGGFSLPMKEATKVAPTRLGEARYGNGPLKLRALKDGAPGARAGRIEILEGSLIESYHISSRRRDYVAQDSCSMGDA